jgi:hypothetical protein
MRLSRLRLLYGQATAAGWLPKSEANFRNFIAAAARATRVAGDPVRIFVAIVRKGLWHHLSNEDEARALTAIKRDAERRFTRSQPLPEATSFASKAPEALRTLVMGLSLTGTAAGFNSSEARELEHSRSEKMFPGAVAVSRAMPINYS